MKRFRAVRAFGARGRKIRYALIFAIVLVFSVEASPGQRSDAPNGNSAFGVTAVVLDQDGKFVAGIGKDDFSVRAFGREQKVLDVAPLTGGVTIGILVDSSGSMRRRGLRVVEGLERFLKSNAENNRYFVMSFSDESEIIQDFTSDRKAVFDSVVGNYSSITKGNTFLIDGLNAGIDKLMTDNRSDKVILLVSDAVDTKGKHFKELKERFRNTDVRFFMVNIPGNLGSEPDLDGVVRMDKLAGLTGGQVYVPRTDTTVFEAFERIAEELKHGYRIRFEADRKTIDQAVRRNARIEVEVTVVESRQGIKKKRKGFHVRTRSYVVLTDNSKKAETH